jgi:hypothetical protein
MKLQNLIYIALVLAWFGPGQTAQAVSPTPDGGYLGSVTPPSGYYEIDGDLGPTLPNGWVLVGVSDFNGDGHRNYVLFNPTTRLTATWYPSGGSLLGGAYGPTVPNGWQLLTIADFNGDNKPDYVLFNPTTRQTAIWYLNHSIPLLSTRTWGQRSPATGIWWGYQTSIGKAIGLCVVHPPLPNSDKYLNNSAYTARAWPNIPVTEARSVDPTND